MSRLWSQKAFLNSVKTAGTSKGPGRKPSPRPTAPPADKFIKAWMIPSPSVFSGLAALDEPLRAIVT